MREPSVSVVLPFFNSEKTLARAISSILYQTIDDWELILVDDCSSDHSVRIAASFADSRITILRNKINQGLASSLNKGIAHARGRYVCRMDADDVSYPERLERQKDYLDSHRSIDLLGCAILTFAVDGRCKRLLRPAQHHQEIKKSGLKGAFALFHPTWMVRKSWLLENPYDERFRKAQDYELLLRAADHSHFSNLPEVLLGYSEDTTNLRKRWITRGYVLLAQKKNLLDQGKVGDFLFGSTMTLIKGLSDILLFSLHLQGGYKHHMSVAEHEQEKWRSVLQGANS